MESMRRICDAILTKLAGQSANWKFSYGLVAEGVYGVATGTMPGLMARAVL